MGAVRIPADLVYKGENVKKLQLNPFYSSSIPAAYFRPCQLTEYVQGGDLVNTALEGGVCALAGVNDTVHVLCHVDLQFRGGGSATPQSGLG